MITAFPLKRLQDINIKRLLAAAFVYIENNKIQAQDMRFDIVSVDLNREQSEITKNAFEVNYFLHQINSHYISISSLNVFFHLY
jgi:hypothetical protein